MFSNKAGTNLPVAKSNSNGDIPSIIASDSKIIGNLVCGSIEIEGEIEGNVTCGHVTVRRTGSVKGDVVADEINIDGEIHGLVKGVNVTVSDTGRVTGIIMYESLSVKDGAYIDGQCKSVDKTHRSNVETISQDDIEEENFQNGQKVVDSKKVKAEAVN